jgi:hypothetical protein
MRDGKTTSEGWFKRVSQQYAPYAVPVLLCCLVLFDWVWPLQGGPAAIEGHHAGQLRLCVGFTVSWSDNGLEADRFYVLVPYSLRSLRAAVLEYSSRSGVSYGESRLVLVGFAAIYAVAFLGLARHLERRRREREAGSVSGRAPR